MEYSNAQQMKYPVRKIYCSRKGRKLSKYVLSSTGLNKSRKSIKQQVQKQGTKQEKMKREISELVKIIEFKASTFIALLNKLETKDRKESNMLNFCPGWNT